MLAALPAPPATISVASYFEDQHRRFARDARDLAVDELIGDEVADHQHAAAAEAVDEREQTFLALGFAGQRVHRTGNEHLQSLPSIQLAAAIRLSTTASAVRSRGRFCSSDMPYPVLTRTAFGPDGAAQRDVDPPVADDKRTGRVDAELAHRAIDQTAAGLPAVAALRVPLATLPSGWCGQ